MMKIFHDGDGGLFGVAMGGNHYEPTERDLDAILTMQDVEDAFECHMNQAARTKFDDDLHIRLALSALIESWRRVTRARAAAGY